MEQPVTSVDNGRSPGGRFAPGNRFATGNPNSRRMHDLRRVLLEAVGDDDIRAVVARLFEQAKGGDVQAAKLVLEYAVGRPAQSVELSGPDGAVLDLGRLGGEVLAALAGYPEARILVAARLRSLVGEDLGHDGNHADRDETRQQP
jgi:hypothetical protein